MVGARRVERRAAQRRAAATLSTFLCAQDEVESVKILKVIKANDKNWVLIAMVNGEKVVVKKYLGGNADKTVMRLQDELGILERVFGTGSCQANRCLMAWPAGGVVVLSFAPGQRLDHAIANAQGSGRDRLLTHSGAWLAQYTQGRRKDGTFGPAFWIKRMRMKDRAHIQDQDDLRLLDALLERLKQDKPRLSGCHVVQAASHGDFTGMNAHYHEGTIYGVDIQGECWIPLARDCARFLVWLQIHDDARPEKRTHGIDTPTWHGFLKSGVLSEEEQGTTLPFFVGEQLYSRFVSDHGRPRAHANTAAAIKSYLGDAEA